MQITITKLTKTYKGGVRAIDGVDLSLGPGMTGLLGANGAGKTTLMRMLTGIIPPTSGALTIGRHDLATSVGRAGVKAILGYLPQELELYPDLSGRELLDYLALLKGLEDKSARHRQVDTLLDRVSLTGAASRRVKGYSGGMKRRLGIAQALLGNPPLVIVDEPTAGLDPEERMRFRALLASLGEERTVILSTHILDDVAQTCPVTAVLARGQLEYHGATHGLLEQARGRTYVLATSGPTPAGDHGLVNAQATAAGTVYRLVTDDPPTGAIPAEPTLEDGYVALMRAIRQPLGQA
ncbi:MAG: ATP-binding cassette domain-containing protein [Acidimicrobiales bacterium]